MTSTKLIAYLATNTAMGDSPMTNRPLAETAPAAGATAMSTQATQLPATRSAQRRVSNDIALPINSFYQQNSCEPRIAGPKRYGLARPQAQAHWPAGPRRHHRAAITALGS